MELYAEEHAVEPSEALSGQSIKQLINQFGRRPNFYKTSANTRTKKNDEEEENNVIPARRRQNSFYKYAFAACLVYW
jgi:hypothetical protein